MILEFGVSRSHVVLETYRAPGCWKSDERHVLGMFLESLPGHFT